MGCTNMRIEEWSPEQLEKGIIQLHVQHLRANGTKTRIRHSASVTIHTTDRKGLFDAASKAIVKLGVVRSGTRDSEILQEGPLVDPDRKRCVKT